MNVQQYLAKEGVCSRREAERLLKAGLIYVNGQKAVPGVPIEDGDVVTLDPKAQKNLETKMTVAVYKPRGVMCSRSEAEGEHVFDIFPRYKHLNFVGRLDKESEGLLLLSNDGLVTKRITGDDHAIEKEYEVVTREDVFADKLQPMVEGMKLSDGLTLPAQVEIMDKHAFRIVLHEGRNRQIRRMCGQLNLEIISLKRIRIGFIELEDMQPGDSYELTPEEVDSLRSGL